MEPACTAGAEALAEAEAAHTAANLAGVWLPSELCGRWVL
jgi:hypothetical protein